VIRVLEQESNIEVKGSSIVDFLFRYMKQIRKNMFDKEVFTHSGQFVVSKNIAKLIKNVLHLPGMQ